MRDIRDDLRARRAAVIGEYSDAMHRFEVEIERLHRERRAAVDAFESEKATLEAMIVMEERRLNSAPTPTLTKSTLVTLPLKDFIVAKVQSAGPIGKDDLAAEAEAAGYAERGRAFNMTLQNIAKGSKIERLDDGRYAACSLPTNLFGMGRSTKETPMTAQ